MAMTAPTSHTETASRPVCDNGKFFHKDNFYLYHADCLEMLPTLNKKLGAGIDLIFADPPYFLSNDGFSCHAGKRVSVNKGEWDKNLGAKETHEFNLQWLSLCKELLKPNGSICISGTHHIIFSIGYALQELNYKILNIITWEKPNPPPNLSCRYLTHSTELVLWASRDKKSKHKYNYDLMRKINNNKQMKDVWQFTAPNREEKSCGKHPTQKPLALLERLILMASDEGDLVLDPFSGSATTGIAAIKHHRHFIGIEKEKEFYDLAINRFHHLEKTIW